MKSHLISQTLLKRFTTNNKIQINDRYTLDSRVEFVDNVAHINIEKEVIGFMEAKWGRIENRMGKAFSLLDSGTLLKSIEMRTVVKQFIALHFVRSAVFIQMISKQQGSGFDSFINDFISKNPENKLSIIANLEFLRNDWKQSLVRMMPQMYKDNYKKVYDYISQSDIEIGEVYGSANFILSDAGVVNISDDGKIGVLSGVGITNSVAAVLPLGPRHIGSLIKNNNKSSYLRFDNDKVKKINSTMLKSCIREFYSVITT